MTNQNLDSNNNGKADKADKADDSDALGGADASQYALLGKIGVADLSFDPATQSELDTGLGGKADDPHDNAAHSTNYSAEDHDHSGGAINPSSVSADSATVANAPTNSTDVVRKQELDAQSSGGSGAAAAGVVSSGTRSTLKISPVAGPGFDFASDQVFSDTFDIEGLAYRPSNGMLYAGEDAAPATIREINPETGAVTDTYAFPSGSGFDHVNNLNWLDDGRLLVGDASPTKGAVVDFDAKTLDTEIAFEGGLDAQQMRAIIPTADGTPKLLFTTFDFDDTGADGAALVDLNGMIANGTTTGNIEATFDSDYQLRMQGAEWVNGYLYTATHTHIAKYRVPYAEHITDGFGLTTDLVWLQPRQSGLALMEEPTYDPDNKQWYIGAGSASIHRATEANGTRRLGEWSAFPTIDRGIEGRAALNCDSTIVTEGGYNAEIFNTPKTGILDVWIYDTLSSTGDWYVTVASGGASSSTRQALGMNESVVSGSYIRDNGTAKTGTGVARPPSAQWVKFRFVFNGSSCRFHISTDYGSTWQSAGSHSSGATEFDTLRLAPFNGSNFQAGSWSIQIIE